jgi:hypothetical protein
MFRTATKTQFYNERVSFAYADNRPTQGNSLVYIFWAICEGEAGEVLMLLRKDSMLFFRTDTRLFSGRFYC